MVGIDQSYRCVYKVKESKVYIDKTLYIKPVNLDMINEETESKTGVTKQLIE